VRAVFGAVAKAAGRCSAVCERSTRPGHGPRAQLFAAQLQATAGAGTLPPGAARVLAARACRTAAKFGDAVPPGRAVRLLEELARTALCFRCARLQLGLAHMLIKGVDSRCDACVF